MNRALVQRSPGGFWVVTLAGGSTSHGFLRWRQAFDYAHRMTALHHAYWGGPPWGDYPREPPC